MATRFVNHCAPRRFYRRCRRLYHELATSWRGMREALRSAISRFLKPPRRKLGFLYKVEREARFAILVAGVVLAGAAGMEVADAAVERAVQNCGIGEA